MADEIPEQDDPTTPDKGVMPEHERAQTETEILVLRQTLQNARMSLANMKVQFILDKEVPGALEHSGLKNHPEQIKPMIEKQQRAVDFLEDQLQKLLDGREENAVIFISSLVEVTS